MSSLVKWEFAAQTITKTGGAWPADTAVERPKGVDLVGIQVTFSDAGGGFNGATVRFRLQGSINGTNWIDVYEGEVSATANGSQMLGGTDQVIGIGQFDQVRGSVADSAGASTDGNAVTWDMVADFET